VRMAWLASGFFWTITVIAGFAEGFSVNGSLAGLGIGLVPWAVYWAGVFIVAGFQSPK
jgi:hypothetical protein